MNFKSLQEHDSTLQSCSFSLSEDFEFKTISVFSNPKNSCIYFLKDKKYFSANKERIEKTEYSHSLLITTESFFTSLEKADSALLNDKFAAIAFCKNVDLCMSFLSKPFFDEIHKSRNELVDGRQMGTAKVHPTCNIAQNVFIGENVEIAENVTILSGSVIMSGSKLGANTYIYPNVTIYPDVEVGSNCRVHANSSIGSDGFGYNHDQGVHHKVWHIGQVIIGNDVEIGAGCCIDRGALGDTKIGDGTKLDNSVHIAHNCEIGKGVILCGLVGVAGSAKVGDYTMVGGAAAIGPGVEIGMASQVGGLAGVTNSWPAQSIISGCPARPVKEWLKGQAALRKLAIGGKR